MTHPEKSENIDETILWQPSQERIKNSLLNSFIDEVCNETGQTFRDYQDFWLWSTENLESFWSKVWDFCGIIGEKGETILQNPTQMIGTEFFPQASISYAENMLKRRDSAPAIIFRSEKGDERTLSFAELYDAVSRLTRALQEAGVKKGDRVAGYLPNMPEAVIGALAANSLGAIWSSASPDFGVEGVVDRFGQIEPKILIGVDGYFYNGKTINCLDKIRDIQPRLNELEKTVIIPFVNEEPDLSGLTDAITYADFTTPFEPKEIAFKRLPFNHPLFIMFSSGTTGKPKSIVHGQGGTLIQHLKEHKLQSDVHPGDTVFYFTTTGWMMWNWLISALASEATLLLYDGSPFYPAPSTLWDYTSAHNCTVFGTGAKYIDALRNEGIVPKDEFDLSDLKTLCSTGSPLVHESFDYIYENIKADLHVASISGGTDIVSCFVLGNPVSPVYRGEIQGAGLGMAVDVYDEDGRPLSAGSGSGELVCTRPFPAMPVYFWNDEDGSRYRSAYFEDFDEDIWAHGDWIERTSNGGFIIHGRSDATLNPGGVRIGTAEIYRQVEQVEDVKEAIAVGQQWDSDVRVILFVILNPGYDLTDDLVKKIKTQIRKGASPRHVPAKVIEVADIPRTKSGKIVELAVRDIIHGRSVKNISSLANPEALDLYKDLDELKN